MKEITLIQPRHIYAPHINEKKLGHIYLPNSLLAISSIFQQFNVNVKLIDENIHFEEIQSNIVGINLVGAPYISLAIDIEERMKKIFSNDFKLLIGGQVVNGLTTIDMKSLFSPNTINGNLNKTISQMSNVEEKDIPRVEDISLINAYKIISDDNLKLYLENEFSFYLSQGCKYSCTFCAARRSRAVQNNWTRITEVYRDINIALSDFEYLLVQAERLKVKKVQIYLSNLDLFQSPQNLEQFIDGVIDLIKSYKSINIVLRGLSTAQSFLQVHYKNPKVILKMKEAGLDRIGFGIDGATPKVFRETRKPQSVKDCLDAVIVCRREYDITPETLLVFGHNNSEDESALKAAVDFSSEMQLQYNTIPRPHVAKDMVSGNDGWYNKNNSEKRQILYDNPLFFQNLDFTALPSFLTHPDPEFRHLVTKYYKMVCELPSSLTKYTLPLSSNMSYEELEMVRKHNCEQYDI